MQSRAELHAENQRLQSLLEDQNTRIAQLEEMLRLLRHKQYGASSEQHPNQQQLFDDAGDEDHPAVGEAETVPVRPHQRRRGGRARLPEDLPRVEIVHDLDDADKVCAEHGCALTQIGEETSEQLKFIPATVEVERHIRLKYTCPACDGHMVTAPKPPQAIPKSIATASLLAWIAVSKYVDALPLYRQSQIFARIGVELDRTTMATWMIRCGELVQPLINLLYEQQRQQPVIHADETTVQVLSEPDRPAQSKSFMWVSAAGPPGQRTVLFHYNPSRGAPVALDLLGDYTGTLMVDGYEGYDAVCRANGLVRLGCWAHARRRFVEAQRAQPKGKRGKPDQALAWIGKLYRIERSLSDASSEERHAARQAQAVPILKQLRAWLDKSLSTTAPKTALGKALSYLDQQWPRLARYVEDGQYPIDNNRAENAIRPFVIGRKNWLFSQSVSGVRASANLYSLIETAKVNQLDPMTYLMRVFEELPKAQTADELDALLPAKTRHGV